MEQTAGESMSATLPKSLKPLPGVASESSDLATRMAATWAQRPADYQPRTKHQVDGQPYFMNRLIFETSPYLLQHAHNPVNWYPWGDEAFAKAAALGRPVLLSVGYATCHWCHVMEEESFEDEDIARYINENYISIKVDREERPDVDAQYMAAVQAISGQGGWPMTVWLSPNRQPFYGGTYFPPRNGARGVRMGFNSILASLAQMYKDDPKRVLDSQSQLVDEVARRLGGEPAGDLPKAALFNHAFTFYEGNFDPEFGGLTRAPKFPSTFPVRWLCRFHARTGNVAARTMSETTLAKMAGGGIYDHVAGGFHRYSVDEEWLVPHFEKMLYDNALLVPAYLEGYQVTQRRDFAAVADDVLNYMARDLSAPGGGFYAATDADSANPEKGGEREEGWFFTWTVSELAALLSAEENRAVVAYFGVTERGNFEGRNILHAATSKAEVAASLNISEVALDQQLASARIKLATERGQRPAPLLDDKIIAAWNGLAISAFARGAQVLKKPLYLARAQAGMDFILQHMLVDGRLRRTFKNGEARVPAFLEDHAFVLQALIDVYEAGFELKYLRAAIALADDTIRHFADSERGGFYQVADDHESMLVREKPNYDGATPSGNSVMALSLLRLAELTDAERFRIQGTATISALSGILHRAPAALAEMLLAADFLLSQPKQIVLVTKGELTATQPFLDAVHDRFIPNKVLAVSIESELSAASDLMPLFHDRSAGSRGVTAYVCQNRACQLPVDQVSALLTLLETPS